MKSQRYRHKRPAPSPSTAFARFDETATRLREEAMAMIKEIERRKMAEFDEAALEMRRQETRRQERYNKGVNVFYEVLAGGAICRFVLVRVGPGFVTVRGVGGMSVTNAAEEVVRALLWSHGFRRFFYYDTDGRFDELCHDGKGFTQINDGSAYQGDCG